MIMQSRTSVLIVLALHLAFLTGCGGKYAMHYVRIAEAKSAKHWPEAVLVDSFPSADSVVKYGLHALGYSVFYEYNNDYPAVNDARINGKYVGADLVVILKPKMLGSETSLVEVPHVVNAYTESRSRTTADVSGTISRNYLPFATYSGQVSGTTNTETRTTIMYTTQEYRTFTKYLHGALFLKVNDSNYVKRLDSVEVASRPERLPDRPAPKPNAKYPGMR